MKQQALRLPIKLIFLESEERKLMVMENLNFPLNEDELFYKSYHAAARSPQTLQTFLKSVNKKDVLKRRLIVPEIFPNQIYGEETSDRIIVIRRYNRYTPAILHRHAHFEIACVFGECVFNVGFEKLSLTAGDVIILPPEILHTVEAFSDAAIIFDINLRGNGFYETFAPLIKGSHAVNKFFAEGLHGKGSIKYLLFHTADDNFLRENILRMFGEGNGGDEYTEQLLIGYLLLGFVRVMRRHLTDFEMSELQPTNLPDNFLVMKYIQENLATVTLEKLAEHFNFSVSHCSRLIKAATGLNFNEWRKTLRLNRAEYLLTNTNQRVEEISSAIGYLNAENFIRAFQKEFGMTPAKYRKTNKK